MSKQKPTVSESNGIQELNHPAFGTIEVTRPTSSPGTTLFGSDLRHSHYIRVSISTASVSRSLSSDWIHPEEQILTFNLSEAQWAKFVSGAGRSLATPITLERVTTGPLSKVPAIEYPEETRKDTFDREFRNKLKEALDDVRVLTERLEELSQGKSVSKVALKEVTTKLKTVSGNLPSNLAFAVEQFKELTESIAEEAKAEVEAYAEQVILSKGLQSMTQQPTLPFEKR
jgi:hypothetical protein